MENERDDHDQRLKTLLKEFFAQFVCCFFPEWGERFDFSEVVWLDKELFLAPPAGERRQLDLVARLRIRADAPPPFPNCEGLLVLVHIEVESADSVQPLRPRMFEYYVQLRREYQLPVLPIGLYLRVGLNGIGWDAYEERFWDHVLLRFQYSYVGLPALDAEEYVKGEQLIGAALSSLMRVPEERRAELYAEALKRITGSDQNDIRRHLLAECVEAYSNMDQSQLHRLDELLDTDPYQEVRKFMVTTYSYQRGKLEGKMEGKMEGKLEGKMEGKLEGKMEGKLEGKMEGKLETIIALMQAKFGPLPSDLAQRVAALDSQQLDRLTVEILKADSLKELRLD